MTTIAPVTTRTAGQILDADLAALKAKAGIIETDVESEATKVWTWFKANVVHIAGYTSIVAALKHLI
jgi:hypothetical protein